MGVKILSLYDGMACGMIAMQLAGVDVESYDAYEIDKYAIKTAQHNFPMIKEHGDVFDADFTQYEDVALRHRRKMSGADFGGEFWGDAVLVSDIINACPVDAVEVVRCKDCKHYEIHKPKVLENCERNGYIIPMKPDDFCSYGERKNG